MGFGLRRACLPLERPPVARGGVGHVQNDVSHVPPLPQGPTNLSGCRLPCRRMGWEYGRVEQKRRDTVAVTVATDIDVMWTAALIPQRTLVLHRTIDIAPPSALKIDHRRHSRWLSSCENAIHCASFALKRER